MIYLRVTGLPAEEEKRQFESHAADCSWGALRWTLRDHDPFPSSAKRRVDHSNSSVLPFSAVPVQVSLLSSPGGCRNAQADKEHDQSKRTCGLERGAF
jgi:hypothetical protein